MEKKMSYEYFKEKVLSPQYKYYNNNPLKISVRLDVVDGSDVPVGNYWTI